MARAGERGLWLTYGYFQTCAIVSEDVRTKVERTIFFLVYVCACLVRREVGLSGLRESYFVRYISDATWSQYDALLYDGRTRYRVSNRLALGVDVNVSKIAILSYQGSCLGCRMEYVLFPNQHATASAECPIFVQ
jgi:hypothetical protein